MAIWFVRIGCTYVLRLPAVTLRLRLLLVNFAIR
jgi:hypothetical protein